MPGNSEKKEISGYSMKVLKKETSNQVKGEFGKTVNRFDAPGPVRVEQCMVRTGNSTAAKLIGGIAGVLASTAMGYFLKGNAPVFDSKLKNAVTQVGLGLVGSAVGSFVSKDVTETVDDTLDVVEEFRREVASRKAGERDGR